MSGLFPRFQAALRNFAAAKLAASTVGKALANLGKRIHSDVRATAAPRRSGHGAAPTKPDIMRAASAAARASKAVRGTNTAEGMRNEILKRVTKAAGSAADVVEALLRPGGKPLATLERELAAAASLLRQFGYSVEPPQRQAEPRHSGPTQRPSQRPRPIAEPESEFAQPQSDLDNFRVGGRHFQFKPNDPILTGEMIPVQSSNVHSIGYIWNEADSMKGTLKVRFLGTNRSTSPQSRGGKGPVYHYFGVHPAVFEAFRTAASKGKFVWDRLRVRGTVSGHQFPYELAKLQSDGYVPRKATRIGGDEHFIRRIVKGQNGRTYTSALQNEFVRRVGVNNPPPAVIAGRGAPNRGTPDRGGPSRGTPKRGRP